MCRDIHAQDLLVSNVHRSKLHGDLSIYSGVCSSAKLYVRLDFDEMHPPALENELLLAACFNSVDSGRNTCLTDPNLLASNNTDFLANIRYQSKLNNEEGYKYYCCVYQVPLFLFTGVQLFSDADVL